MNLTPSMYCPIIDGECFYMICEKCKEYSNYKRIAENSAFISFILTNSYLGVKHG